MNKMFYNCNCLINLKLDFSGIQKEIDINNIFSNCYNFFFIDISTLDKNKNISNEFKNCINLLGIKVSDKSYLDIKYSNINNLSIYKK